MCCVTSSSKPHPILTAGVMPNDNFYGPHSFRKILGHPPAQEVMDALVKSKKQTFQNEELVVVKVITPEQDIVTVFGRILGKALEDQFEVATYDLSRLPFGFQGYTHTLAAKKIGKIPSSFSQQLQYLEEHK